MVERILSYKKVSAYLEGLADRHIDINSFIGDNPKKLDDILGSEAGLQAPAMNFYGYSWKLSGNNQRTFNTRVLGFAILFDVSDPEDYAAQEDATEKAEAIGLEVFSRIYQDSLNPDIGWLYNNLIKESIVAEPILMRKDEGLCGMDFTFELKVSEPLVVDKAKWSDGNLICG